MEQASFLRDHGDESLLGVKSLGGAGLAAQSAVEAFEVADGAQVFAAPGGELL